MRSAAVVLPVLAVAGSALAVPVQGNFTVDKRDYTDAKYTWYDITVGETACGGWYSSSDYVSVSPSNG